MNLLNHILFILICSILCGFKNIYQKKTLIQYSPNTRAFAEGILDPAFIIYSKLCFNPSIFLLIIYGNKYIPI